MNKYSLLFWTGEKQWDQKVRKGWKKEEKYAKGKKEQYKNQC